jgi:competence protein ComEC
MAISGLHVGMVAATGYFLAGILGGLLRLRLNLHFLSTIVALTCAAAYALMSGLAVPAQRALLMAGLSAMVVLRNRIVRPFTVIAATCLLLAMMSPLATLAPGFRLSFAAVVILVWLARRLVPRSGMVLRRMRAVHLLIVAQFALLLGLLPVTALEFGRIALAAPVVNLVAVPVFSMATVPLTAIGLLLAGPLEGIGNHALQLAASSLGVVEWAISRSLELPGASLHIPRLQGWPLAMLWLSVGWAALPPGWPGRNIAWLSLAFVVLYEPPRPLPGCARLDVLDVGQGLAIVVSTRSSTLLFDTGPAFRSGGSAADTVILPFLANRKIDAIDYLVVSHADLDHAGGLASITAGLRVGRLYAGEPVNSGIPGTPCREGDSWASDGVNFDFLYPAVGRQAEGNDASCVLQVSAGPYRVLLTGDIEGGGEGEMQRSGRLRSAAVVVVPHHGSRTSSGPDFVSLLRPGIAIISAGYNNRWGHPDAAVVARWRATGSTVLGTAQHGAISFSVCKGTGVHSLSRHRAQVRRIWHE